MRLESASVGQRWPAHRQPCHRGYLHERVSIDRRSGHLLDGAVSLNSKYFPFSWSKSRLNFGPDYGGHKRSQLLGTGHLHHAVLSAGGRIRVCSAAFRHSKLHVLWPTEPEIRDVSWFFHSM